MFGRYGADWQSLKATNLHGVPLLPYVCPLSVPTVMDGWPMASNAPLLRLPGEILTQIVQEIEWTDLQAFALVNSDCCQFARSRLFAWITLDFSPSACGLVALPKMESE
jgi:hypothetical protein